LKTGRFARDQLVYPPFTVRQGKNALQLGIAAVHARLASGKLKVLAGRCPNLLAEPELYRFSDAPDERDNETPLSAHNHALDALRYLITRLDAHKMAQQARDPPSEPAACGEDGPGRTQRPRSAIEMMEDERMWR